MCLHNRRCQILTKFGQLLDSFDIDSDFEHMLFAFGSVHVCVRCQEMPTGVWWVEIVWKGETSETISRIDFCVAFVYANIRQHNPFTKLSENWCFLLQKKKEEQNRTSHDLNHAQLCIHAGIFHLI